jgi:hypothetical protein
VLRDHNVVGGEIKATIHFVIRVIANENTPSGTWIKLMCDCCGKVGIAGTPKDAKMLIGGWLVILGGVRARGSDGFYWETI